MLLDGKNAVVYGAGGAIGGAIARAFAREGANVFLAGRDLAAVEAVAKDISDAGGVGHAAQVDALQEQDIETHIGAVVDAAGGIDVSINAIGIGHVQGTALVELSLEDFMLPITTYTTTQFLTARAAARRMVAQGSGVIQTLSTPAALRAGPSIAGFGTACAAVEGLSRHLAGELGPQGIRVICLRPDAIPEAADAHSHSREVFRLHAQRMGVTPEQFWAQLESGTLLRRLPTLLEVANVAAFTASDQAGAMTGTVANLSSGSVVD